MLLKFYGPIKTRTENCEDRNTKTKDHRLDKLVELGKSVISLEKICFKNLENDVLKIISNVLLR